MEILREYKRTENLTSAKLAKLLGVKGYQLDFWLKVDDSQPNAEMRARMRELGVPLAPAWTDEDGQQLMQTIKGAGVKVAFVAKTLGCHSSEVYGWIKRDKEPSIHIRRKMDEFGLPERFNLCLIKVRNNKVLPVHMIAEIKQDLRQHKMTESQLVGYLGVHRNTIKRWLREKEMVPGNAVTAFQYLDLQYSNEDQ